MTDKPSAEAMREAVAVLRQQVQRHIRYSEAAGFTDTIISERHARLEAVATYLMEQVANE